MDLSAVSPADLNPLQLMHRVAAFLEEQSIRYRVVGSLASMAYGEPRFTNDIDVLADIRLEHAAARGYIAAWSVQLGVRDEWEALRADLADRPPSGSRAGCASDVLSVDGMEIPEASRIGVRAPREPVERVSSPPKAEDGRVGLAFSLFRGRDAFRYDPARGRFRDWLGTVVRHAVAARRRSPTSPG